MSANYLIRTLILIPGLLISLMASAESQSPTWLYSANLGFGVTKSPPGVSSLIPAIPLTGPDIAAFHSIGENSYLGLGLIIREFAGFVNGGPALMYRSAFTSGVFGKPYYFLAAGLAVVNRDKFATVPGIADAQRAYWGELVSIGLGKNFQTGSSSGIDLGVQYVYSTVVGYSFQSLSGNIGFVW